MQGIAPSADAQYDGVPLDAPPSVRQGYGRADLTRALPLASSTTGWNLQVRDDVLGDSLGFCRALWGCGRVDLRAAHCRWQATPLIGTCRHHLCTLIAPKGHCRASGSMD